MLLRITNNDLIDGKIPNEWLHDGITELDLSGCSLLESLPENLPAGITVLELYGCSSLTSLPELPAGITKLDLSGCTSLTSLPILPDTITELHLTKYNQSAQSVELYDEITNPDLANRDPLTRLAEIMELDDNYDQSAQLPELSDEIMELDDNYDQSAQSVELYDEIMEPDDNYDQSAQLPELPAEILELNDSYNQSVQLPELPAEIMELAQLTQLSTLTRLEKLYLSDYDLLTSLPELSDTITELRLFNTSSLTHLPATLTRLKKLYLRGCNVPELSNTITHLSLIECFSLSQLPELPAGIKHLNLRGCSSLTSLPENLPAGIEELDLSGCSSLTSLPELPAGITKLNLEGCTSLEPTEEMLRQFDEIERNNRRAWIIRPRHWRMIDMVANRVRIERVFAEDDAEHEDATNTLILEQAMKLDEIKDRLEEIVKDMSPKPAIFQGIFHRFTTQNIRYDRGIDEVIKTTDLVVSLLEKNPTHANWMNEMAGHCIQGCVNQSVQGFIEIAGFTGVCQKESVRDKMEASKQILARMAIIGFIATLDRATEHPGGGVEVEFANVLMREVNKKLLEDGVIKESWPGVPNRIAYEGMVEAKANFVFNRAYEYVKQEAVNLEHKEIGERLLGFLKGGAEGKDPPYRHVALAWMDTMITGSKDLEDKSREIDQKYEEEKEYCGNEMEFLDFASKVNRSGGALEGLGTITALQDVEENDKEKFARRYQEDFIGLLPGNKAQKLTTDYEKISAKFNSIESRKESDKVEMIMGAVVNSKRKEYDGSHDQETSDRSKRRGSQSPSTSIRGVTAAAVDDVQNARSS